MIATICFWLKYCYGHLHSIHCLSTDINIDDHLESIENSTKITLMDTDSGGKH